MAELVDKFKRARTQSWSGLPDPGEEASDFLVEQQHCLRHGSSLALMSLVSTALNQSDEFGDMDPEEDWKKWSERRPDFKLYYAALIDPARDGPESVACVLRAVLDPVAEDGAPAGRRARLLIDYVTTRPSARGKGLATALVRFVTRAAAANDANVYVLALEDACVYWMRNGFVLEASERLTCRFNIFSDCHLLRRADDPLDAGEPGDEDLKVEHSESSSSSDDDDDDDDDNEDPELARVLALSAREAAAPAAPDRVTASALAAAFEDAELQAALARSRPP